MKKILLISVIILAGEIIIANNLTISNSSLQVNPNSGYVFVQFDLAWENSWRTSTGAANWDAAWIFIKYRVGSGEWQHAKLSPVSSNHIAPANASIYSTSDGMGAFIYRSSDGSGNISFPTVKLAWNYALDGVADGATIDFKVMGIEMVYVTQGNFWLGDGASTNTLRQTGSNIPVQITSGSVVVKQEGSGATAGDAVLESGVSIDGDGGICSTGTGAIDNSGFPTGFKAFYCMKYEASQGQYAAFLNLLTAAQASARYDAANSGTYRYTISGTWPNLTASAPDRACNFISVDDLAAYADWSGLRPMTELEYEKICRGTNSSVANEYAWGNTNLSAWLNVITNNGLSNESVNAEANTGNCTYKSNNANNGINGPLRCGIYAASSPNKTRQETGSGYYGIMESSGNVWETVVSIGRPQGRLFTGLHGNGSLTSGGAADVANWPTNTNLSTGYRGSSWQDVQARLHVSDRYVSGNSATAVRSKEFGIRCVRGASTALLATITTNTITSVTSSTATCGGNIPADGGEPVLARGVCWSTTSNPTIANSKTTDGTGTGSFTSAIKGLIGSTTYYVRAYVTNVLGTTYGNEYSIITDAPVFPSISTAIPLSATSTTAKSGGVVTDEGGAVTTHGVCWSSSPNPTISNNKTIDGTGMVTFTSIISGLTPGQTYFVKAYATNSVGTVYGEEKSFIHCSLGGYLGGGVTAYIYQPEDPEYIPGETHGIIAAPSDQGNNLNFGTAYNLCNDLVLDGYDDWRLPTRWELNKLYINRNIIGGFSTVWNTKYWSIEGISGTSPTIIYSWDFYSGYEYTTVDINFHYCRAVRLF